MYFSLLPKILLIFLLVKFYFFLFFFELNLSLYFFLIGLLSIVLGGINAMYQLKIKRFLAYSTIANVGYIFISLSIFSLESMFSSIFYLICYLLSVFVFFFFILHFRKGKKVEFFYFFEISIISYNLLLLFFISLIFFSFIGLPPFLGFFGKLFVYFNLLVQKNYFTLAILLIFSVVIGFYYLRVVRFLFFSNYIFEKNNIFFLEVSNIFVIFIIINLFFLFFFDIICEYIIEDLCYSFLNL
jgi:NADH:ubiquinone oxidoreductase subunit 2 (subunit N)